MIVVWRVTARCNLFCPFCAYDRALPGRRLAVKPEDTTQFASVLGEYRQSSGKKVLISWIGGEPLLWPPLFGVSRRLNQDFGVELSATTNGTTLHIAKVQKQLSSIFQSSL